MKKLLLILLFLCTLIINANATTYYVATTGNDSNSGLDLGNAFLTMQKGVDSAINPDDVVLVDDGTYTSQVTINAHSGSAESPKTITAITNANPCVVTSAAHGYSNGDIVEILGVTNYLTTGMQQLYSKFFKVANATTDTFELTTPITGVNVDSTLYDPYVGSGTVTRIHPITIRAINRDQVIIDISSLVSTWTGSGTYTSAPVSIASASSSAILWRTDSDTPGSESSYKSSCASISTEGDYCYTGTAFQLKTSVNPNSYTYRGFRRGNGTGISINSVQYILLDGFKVQYGSDTVFVASSIAEGAHIVLDNIHTYRTVYHGGIYILGYDAFQLHNVTVDNSQIEYQWDNGTGIDSNGHGIKIGGISNTSNEQYITVSNSTIHDIRQHGIQFSNGVTSGYFYGNRIYGYSLKSSGSFAGIRSGLGETNHIENKDTQIFDNDIGNTTGGTGYSIGCSIFIQDDNRGACIFRNRIHHNTWHGIYLFYTSGARAPSEAKIFNNLFYENKTAGIRTDNSYGGTNGNIQIENNSFYLNGESAIAGIGATLSMPQVFSSGIGFRNNIVYNINGKLMYSSNSLHLYPSDYNIYYRTSGFEIYFNGVTYTSLAAFNAATTGVDINGLDAHSKTGDPLYADAPAADFRIPSPITPADAAGTNLLSTIKYDYNLQARQTPFDCGSYNTTGNLILFASVTPASLFPGRSGNNSAGFTTTEISILKNDKLVLTYPAGFVLDNGGVTDASSFTGLDGTFTTSVNGQVVTIARNNDGTDTSPASFTFILSHIKNPAVSGLTDPFEIKLTDVNDVEKARATTVPGIEITDIAPGVIAGAVVSAAKVGA